jgi:hypothetical protein
MKHSELRAGLGIMRRLMCEKQSEIKRVREEAERRDMRLSSEIERI